MKIYKKKLFFALLFVSAAIMANCSSVAQQGAMSNINYSPEEKEFIRDYESWARHYKIGKPYKVAGDWYYPHHQPSYNKVGYASWYGPNVDALTANGELFDPDELSAAHPTLPLPSIVEVTNLNNGKKVVVKVNDRGPFDSDRVIDLTVAAAEKIDMIDSGVAKVRVRLLQDETLSYLKYEH
ncbi:MAG: hypothetical protein COV36_03370 [Alphaproteobacteria bacterium CG11_big_fil_rev_8_21_14_0_20_44_7]|nr:MAG: hypothetical protein COV36_03370 [Alphaproteobacteria bacterium CG11_big_fil_rev_8_21_14_0_20_44_7]